MGISRDIYHNGELTDWQTWILTILNVLTLLITVFNLIYLYRNMPKAHEPQSVQQVAQLQPSSSVPVLKRQKSIQSVLLSTWRTRVLRFFYIIALVPILLAVPSHYGAQYPSASIWIFPAMDCVVSIAFLTYIAMMIHSCDGLTVIEFYLASKQDTEAKCKCARRANAYVGFRWRVRYCYLIVIKPLIDYTFSYFEYFYGGQQFENALRITLKVLLILCTFVPVTGIKAVHKSLHKYSRMRRTRVKTTFVTLLAPGVQIQQLVVSLLFNFDTIRGFDNVEEEFRWCCLYGMLICLEMVLFAVFVSYFVFTPSDLLLWDDTDVLLAEHNQSTQIASSMHGSRDGNVEDMDNRETNAALKTRLIMEEASEKN